MVEGHPVVWVRKQPGAYQMVCDEHGTRLEPSKSMAVRVVGTVFFLVMASITTLFSLWVYNILNPRMNRPVHRDAGIGKQKSSLAAIPRIVLTEQSEV